MFFKSMTYWKIENTIIKQFFGTFPNLFITNIFCFFFLTKINEILNYYNSWVSSQMYLLQTYFGFCLHKNK